MSNAVGFVLLSLLLSGVSDVIFKKHSGGCPCLGLDSSGLCFNGALLNLRGTRLNSNRQQFFWTDARSIFDTEYCLAD